MHFIHLIAVEADDASEAVKMAEHAIESYGNGNIWDWYEVGGRWDGELEGNNTLCYSENSKAFVKHIDRCKESRKRELIGMLDKLNGTQIKPDDVQDKFVLGIPDPEESANRINEDNKKCAARFQEILKLKDLPSSDTTFGLTGYYLYKLGALISEFYTADSYFYDAAYGSSSFEAIMERCKEEPSRQWLVNIDMHN